jgi:hypothetical protein
MKKLHQYNSFGLIFVTANGIKVNIAAVVTSGQPVYRFYEEEFDEPVDIEKPVMISFASQVELDGKTKTAFYEIGQTDEGPATDRIPQIGKALAKAFDLLRLAVRD